MHSFSWNVPTCTARTVVNFEEKFVRNWLMSGATPDKTTPPGASDCSSITRDVEGVLERSLAPVSASAARSGSMKILSLILMRALSNEPEATTLVSSYMLDDYNYFQKEGYVARLF